MKPTHQRIRDNRDFALIATYGGKMCLVPIPEPTMKNGQRVIIRISEKQLKETFLEYR